jgi:hypothetical protein
MSISDIKRALHTLIELIDAVGREIDVGKEIVGLINIRISLHAPTGLIDVTIPVEERRARYAVIDGEKGVTCANSPYTFNGINIKTENEKLVIHYIYSGKHVYDVIPLSRELETVGDLIDIACNLKPEEIETIINNIRKTTDAETKSLEQLKQIVAIIKMILGVEEQ